MTKAYPTAAPTMTTESVAVPEAPPQNYFARDSNDDTPFESIMDQTAFAAEVLGWDDLSEYESLINAQIGEIAEEARNRGWPVNRATLVRVLDELKSEIGSDISMLDPISQAALMSKALMLVQIKRRMGLC